MVIAVPGPVMLQLLAAETPDDQWSDEERCGWRMRRANYQREDTPKDPQALWAAKELVYWCVSSAPRFAYYVVLRMPMGLDVAAASPAPGERTVRLLYDWQEHVSPHLHLSPSALSTSVLSRLGEEGERLRAAVRYARSVRNGPGR